MSEPARVIAEDRAGRGMIISEPKIAAQAGSGLRMTRMACENGAMEWWSWLLILVVAAIALDRVMLALERRGWVRWRNTKGVGATAMGAAMGEVADAFQPGRRIIVEQRRFDQVRVDESQSGAPPISAEEPTSE